jgi:hypothetical protein
MTVTRGPQPAFDPEEPGIYLVEVTKVEKRVSKKGELMLVVDFRNVASGDRIFRDFMMLEGKGRWAGDAKLALLGINPKAETFDEYAIIGKRAWVSLKAETYNGGQQLKPDNEAAGFQFGYCDERNKPKGAVDPESVADLDFKGEADKETPF